MTTTIDEPGTTRTILTYVAMTANYWGRGMTASEAVLSMKAQLGRQPADYSVWVVPTTEGNEQKVTVNGMGDIAYHPAPDMGPEVILRVRGGKVCKID